ncbi:unnamed protein product, partial [marine sediment metagenome]
SKIGKLEVEENIIKQSKRGIAAINVSEDFLCKHSFIAYIDKGFNVRDCFITDFKVELPRIELEQVVENNVPNKEIVDVIELAARMVLDSINVPGAMHECAPIITLFFITTFFIINLFLMIILDIITLPCPTLTFLPNSMNSQSTHPSFKELDLFVLTPKTFNAKVSRIGKFNWRANQIGHFLTTALKLQ